MSAEPQYAARVRTSPAIPVFVEHQRFALWVYALVIGIMCTSVGAIVYAPGQNGKQIPHELASIYAALFLFLWDVLSLRTVVDQSGVRVRLGWPVPIFWKRISFESIRAARVVTYRPLLDASGWGLRFGRFEGQFTIYWNARGNRGVLIETDSRRYIIGSQKPEELFHVIEFFKNLQGK